MPGEFSAAPGKHPDLELEQTLCGRAADLGDFVGTAASLLQQPQRRTIVHGERIIGAKQQAVAAHQVAQIPEGCWVMQDRIVKETAQIRGWRLLGRYRLLHVTVN